MGRKTTKSIRDTIILRVILIISIFLYEPTESYSQLDKYQPQSTTNQIVKHSNYWFSYSESHEQPEWVYYLLTPQRANGSVKRTDNFRADPKVTTGSASLADYKGSGFDRGHLSPAADNGHSSTAMSESFYMSNMSPQDPSFNRGIWKKLEGQFRNWTSSKGNMYVVTAGVLTSSKGTIGANRVSIPRYYYKIALDTEPEVKAIGFLLPNTASKRALSDFVVSIDSIEAITGIDFFYQVEGQEDFESSVDLDYWDVDNTVSKSSGGTAKQCNGIAKSTGNRCGNKTNNESGYCYLHESQSSSKDSGNNVERLNYSVQCEGTTKAGNRCKNKTKNANRFCHVHQR